MACGEEIDSQKFESYALETAEIINDAKCLSANLANS